MKVMQKKNLISLKAAESKLNEQNAKLIIEKEKMNNKIMVTENHMKMIFEEKLTRENILHDYVIAMQEEKKNYEQVSYNTIAC